LTHHPLRGADITGHERREAAKRIEKKVRPELHAKRVELSEGELTAQAICLGLAIAHVTVKLK
jgi:hypothetical protein